MKIKLIGSIILLLAWHMAGSRPVAGQTPLTWEGNRLQLTRAELEQLLRDFEETGRSAPPGDFRLRARHEAESVRARLRDGDFQVGDQVSVTIEGEANMPLTLPVSPGRVLVFPSLGTLPLTGVLHSELNEKVQAFVAGFIKSPIVHTRSFIRLAVIGEVDRPGFFLLAPESLLADAIMAAGGPTTEAELKAARIERSLEPIWEGKGLQQALSAGRTLDQMSLRSGDQIVIPRATTSFGSGLIRWAAVVPGIVLAITGARAVF